MMKEETSWFSPNLNMEMPIVSYGHAGYPLLMFPTAAADYLEYERFQMLDAIRPFIDAGQIRAYSVNSVNRYSLLNQETPAPLKGELLVRFDRYVTDEVLPFIRLHSGDQKPLVTGASLGSYLALNTYLKHPDLLRGVISMSGSYEIRGFLNGYHDENIYYNNPVEYLPNLNDDYYLPILQKADSIAVITGQGTFEDAGRSRQISQIMHSKNIPHVLDIWGQDVAHDWVWWRKMLPLYLGKFLS